MPEFLGPCSTSTLSTLSALVKMDLKCSHDFWESILQKVRLPLMEAQPKRLT